MTDNFRNRAHNAHNEYQTDAMRVLCVCSAGLLRSPTAANVLHAEYGLNTRAVGSVPAFALIPIDNVHLLWADLILTMSEEQAGVVRNLLGALNLREDPEVVSLDIPDNYRWMDPDLVTAILNSYNSKFL